MSIAEPGNLKEEPNDSDNDVNRVVGAIPKNVLEYLAKSIVDNPEAVVIETDESRNGVTLRLNVAQEDMGKIIGKRGRVATAVRAVVRAAGAREGIDARVDIVD